MFLKKLSAVVAAATFALFAPAPAAKATTIDVDLMFVVDRSGSMGGEFTTLAARIGDVVNGLTGASNGGVTINSVAAGLVSYLAQPRLEQSVTTSVAALQTAFGGVSVSGSTEDSNGAVRSVLPGGSLFGAAGWRANTVKSVVLITDENSDINFDYAGTGALLDQAQYFNNIITTTGLYTTYQPMARPAGGLFDLNIFRTDASTFLTGFTNSKLVELTTGGTATGGSAPADPAPGAVPLPAAGWMLIAGLGGLMAMRRRQSAA